MDKRGSEFRLGVFVLVAGAVLVGILLALGGRSLFGRSLILETYFDESIAGLDIGAPVKFRGVPVGTVSEITFSSAVYEQDVSLDRRKSYIVVRARITAQVAALPAGQMDDEVKRGLRARTELAGITGQQYLAFDFVDPARHPQLPFDWKPEYLYVPSTPSTAGEIIAHLQHFLAHMDEADIVGLIRNANTLVVDIDRKANEIPVAELSRDAAAVLRDARTTIDRLDRMLATAPVGEAVRNIASAGARLDGLLADPKLHETVANVAAFTERLRKIAESGELDRIAADLDSTLGRLNGMLGDNQYDVRVIVQDLRATAGNLRVFSEGLKRDPAATLFGGPPAPVGVTQGPL